ncbi:anti-sigma factor [Candidatus Woesearchaeota archaeon]|nr:anti-sigma factor [Candidatus Woesearchaeota archaeon]
MRLVLIAIIMVLLVVTVFAASGIRAREERLMNPYGRDQYFGEGYQKPLIGYGLKDAPRGSFGSKDTSGGREDFFNSVFRQGRNPGKLSQFDAGYRGYRMIDRIIELTPLETYKRTNRAEAPPRVSVRVVSRQSDSVTELPKSTVMVYAVNLPPLAPNRAYEVWLMDEDSGYELSLGFLRANLRSGVTTARIGLTGGLGGLLASDGTYDLTLYETIGVTEEPFPDPDPRMGELVMIGSIPQRAT